VNREPITIRIEKEIWAEVRKRAIDLNVTAGSLVETAIMKFLRSYAKEDIEGCRKVGKPKEGE
jgi:hypothetical protein